MLSAEWSLGRNHSLFARDVVLVYVTHAVKLTNDIMEHTFNFLAFPGVRHLKEHGHLVFVDEAFVHKNQIQLNPQRSCWGHLRVTFFPCETWLRRLALVLRRQLIIKLHFLFVQKVDLDPPSCNQIPLGRRIQHAA